MKAVVIRSGRRRDGIEIVVDEADLHIVVDRTWSISTKRGSHTKYAQTIIGGKPVYMHRLLMQPPPGMEVDHIDGNALNNSRSNLRVVTHSQNLKAAHEMPGRYTAARKLSVLNRVRRKLADGTIKEYVYDRVSGKRVE